MTSAKFLIISTAAVILSGCLPHEATTEQRTHVFVRTIPQLSPRDAFNTSLRFVKKNFKSSKPVLVSADSANGTIVARGTMSNVEGLEKILKKNNVGFTMTEIIKGEIISFHFHSFTGLNMFDEEVELPDYTEVHVPLHRRCAVIADSIFAAVRIVKKN
jgi:hypothetical protein